MNVDLHMLLLLLVVIIGCAYRQFLTVHYPRSGNTVAEAQRRAMWLRELERRQQEFAKEEMALHRQRQQLRQELLAAAELANLSWRPTIGGAGPARSGTPVAQAHVPVHLSGPRELHASPIGGFPLPKVPSLQRRRELG